MLASHWIGATLAAAIDLSFLAVLIFAMAREIVAGNNKRNLKVLILVAILLAGNLVFHLEANLQTGDGYGIRIGIAATILLITLIGGRIIPSFTRNWLARRDGGRLPIPFNRFDIAVIATSAIALGGWVVLPDHALTAALAIIAGILNLWRLVRWAGDRTTGEPLVLVLHVAYAFVPLGFGLLALAVLHPGTLTTTGAIHCWTTGAIALMTLAVMTRASLGHTGRPLTATGPIQLIYAAAVLAACARIIAAFDVWRDAMLHFSAAAWLAAFIGFLIVYVPLLTRPS